MANKKTYINLPYVFNDETLRFFFEDVANRINDLMNGICVDRPMFLVNPASTQENFSNGDDIAFGTEVFDIGSNFSSPSFTAPWPGKYQFNANIRVDDIDIDATYYLLNLVTTGGTYTLYILDSNEIAASDLDYFIFSGSIMVNMAKDDTAKLQINQSGGAAQSDINTASYFSGFLVG